MNEHVSKHEVILPLVDDKYILFNGLYGAIDAVDQQTVALISDAQLSNTQPKLDADMHERLVRRGHLVDRQTEADDLKILSRLTLHLFDQNSVDLIMMPTYNCNFRCTYCTERHRLTRGQAWLERVMSPAIIDGVRRGASSCVEHRYRPKHLRTLSRNGDADQRDHQRL